MEAERDRESMNSNFRELTREEMSALSDDELQKYLDWYTEFIDIKFTENMERVDKFIEEFKRLANDYMNEASNENRKKLERFVDKKM